jgi:hypothetical protein
MRLEDIRFWTRATPFKPFRVFTTSGESYDIYHPDTILATLGSIVIAIPAAEQPGNEMGSARMLSLYHLQKIEYLPSPPSNPQSNGTTTKPTAS